MENQAAGADVITVVASDLDEGMNAQITYSLVDNIGEKFAVHPSSGKVTTTTPLDREQESSYYLVVEATDQGIPPRSVQAQIEVIVEDDNDHAPEFGMSSYEATMYDSSNTADFVVGVTAVDLDSGNNGKVHYTLEGPDMTYFHVNSVTGVITHAGRGPLESTQRRTFTFSVRASDLGKNPLNSTASVTVTLSSTPTDDRPIFNDVQDSLGIKENEAIGTTLTTVTASSTTGSGVTYHMAGGNVNNAFSVDEETGLVVVEGRIDYEVTNMFELWLEARDQGGAHLSTFQKLIVSVEDENDNSPIFSQAVYHTDLRENCAPKTNVIKVMATDLDSSSNQQLVYSIHNGNTNGTFIIDSTTGQITTSGSIAVDREKMPAFSVEVMAVDMGSPAKSATATVQITVLDENDNEPTFTGSRSVAVPEDLPIGGLVIRMITHDADTGENAQVQFSLTSLAGTTTSHPFIINKDTGEISTTAQLDAEVVERYTLGVSVTDQSFSQSTTVAIRILDVNDNAPSFEKDVLVLSFPELQSPGAIVGKLTAQDLDISSPNNKYFFSLRRPSSQFELNSETGELVALETMQFYGGSTADSTMNDHTLEVLVTDLGIPSLASQATVIVQVTDANDHAPVFSQSSYSSAVPTTWSVGEDIIQVTATDLNDFGRNAEIVYEVISGDGIVFFGINATTGFFNAKMSLSGQLGKKFSLVVRASDKGVPPKSSTCQVELEVTGDNLYPPRFNSNPSSRTVPEDAAVGSLIDTLTATDDDTGLNGEVRYYISTGNNEGLFAVGAEDGRLTVEGELDYETHKSYTITITARDMALIYRQDSRNYTISLSDVNDNRPEFDREYYDAYIEENSMGMTTVMTISASDADSAAANTEIHYTLVSSASGVDQEALSRLQIDEMTGRIYSQQTAIFDYESRTLYTLLVMAYNPSDDILRSVTTVYVHVLGQNEYQPKFEKTSYSFSVSESAETGFQVGTVRAQDQDSGVDGQVYYYLEGDSNLLGFSLEPTTGILRVLSRPDYEASPTLQLKAIAKNWGNVGGSDDTDTCVIIITISDANDPPEFTQSVYRAEIPENTNGVTYVTTVVAEDRDVLAENRGFTYELLSGNDLGKFQVSPSTGKVETTGLGVLDRETLPSYTLVVGAKDASDPSIVGSATVIITLTDVNDNRPRFTPDALIANVQENQTIGTEVIILREFTTDLDEAPNQGPFRYYLLDTSMEAYFSLDPDTGRVTTTRVLSREDTPQFVVALTVSDNGVPSLTSELTFTVVVTDINNSQPRPRPLTIKLAILEGQDASQMGVLASVHPLDADLTGSYSCSIVSGAQSDLVIRQACDLEAARQPRYDVYSLRVSGSDDKYAPVEYDVTLRVEQLTQAELAASVAVVLGNEMAATFLEVKLDAFTRGIESAFGPSQMSCRVFSLQQVDADLHVLLSVRDTTGRLLTPSEVSKGVNDAKKSIEDSAIVSIANSAASACNSGGSEAICVNTGECATVIVPGPSGGAQVSESTSLILTSPATELSPMCYCPPEFTGSRCETSQQRCGDHYCDNGQVCEGSSCVCPTGWEGDHCRVLEDCLQGALCQNGATCVLELAYSSQTSTPSSSLLPNFRCNCAEGYLGRYCELSDVCRTTSCSSHGECQELPGGDYQCLCNYGYHGQHCELESISFTTGSYATFPPAYGGYNIFNATFYFATVFDSGLLLYSPVAVETRGRGSGFIAIEVSNGHAQVSFILDSLNGVITLFTTDRVDDGEWRRLEFTKVSTTASLVVQRCEESSCEACTDQDRTCYDQASLVSDNPSVVGQYVNVGGVNQSQFESDLLPYHAPVVTTHDFVGCAHSILVNGQSLEATLPTTSSTQTSGVMAPQASVGVSPGCPRSSSASLCWEGDADVTAGSGVVVGSGNEDDDAVKVCYNDGACVDQWTSATCSCPPEYMDDQCLVVKQPFTLGSNAVVLYTLKPSYVRSESLASAGSTTGRRRRRRNTNTDQSSVMLRFRTTAGSGILFTSATHIVTCLLWFSEEKIHFLLKSSDAVNDPLSVAAPGVSSGDWHNVTVRTSSTSYTVEWDGVAAGTRDFGYSYNFDSLDAEMTISGQVVVPPDNTLMPGLDGCLSEFYMNDAPLPMNGSSSKYDITVTGEVGGGCGALCEGDPCGGGNTCQVQGEAYVCLLRAENASAGLETGIIIVIVFFALILLVIIAVFVLFRTRRDLFHKCARPKKQSPEGGLGDNVFGSAGIGRTSGSSSANGKVNVHENILNGSVNPRFSPPLNAAEEEAIIRNHIAQNLGTPVGMTGHMNNQTNLSDRPDLIGGSPGYSQAPARPVQLSDGTVILEGGGGDGEEDIPEHYDFENASSIAPSDIAPSDMIRHYRDFRLNGGVHHHHHHHHHNHHQRHHHHHHDQPPVPPPPLNNHLMNKYRESPSATQQILPGYRNGVGPPGHTHHMMHHTRQSPVSLSGSALSVPAPAPDRNHMAGGRPSSAQAAVNLSDGSRAMRSSPLTQLNVVRSPHNQRISPNSHHNNSNSSSGSIHRHHPHHQHSHSHDHSRSDSTQSIGSHHSHSSASSTNGAPPPAYRPPLPTSLPQGLTVEDVNRLNARPDLPDPVSMLDAASSSIDNSGRAGLHVNGGPGCAHHNTHNSRKMGYHNQSPRIMAQDPLLDSSLLLDAPDSSSDDSGANDSFTCSEFEYDNGSNINNNTNNSDPTSRIIPRDRPPGKLIFSRLAEEEEADHNEEDAPLHHPHNNHHNNYNQKTPHIAGNHHQRSKPHKARSSGASSDGLNSHGDSFTSTNASSASGSPASQGISHDTRPPVVAAGSGPYDFDALLSWGPSFDKFVGVFSDIAQLPDTGGGTMIGGRSKIDGIVGNTDHDYEEYV